MFEKPNFFVFTSIQSRYKESWTKVRDGGYKLRLDAIPFQSAKASGEILSDVSASIRISRSVCGLGFIQSYCEVAETKGSSVVNSYVVNSYVNGLILRLFHGL